MGATLGSCGRALLQDAISAHCCHARHDPHHSTAVMQHQKEAALPEWRPEVWAVVDELKAREGPFPRSAMCGPDLVVLWNTDEEPTVQVPQFNIAGSVYEVALNGRRDFTTEWLECQIGGGFVLAAGGTLILNNSLVGGGVRFTPYDGKTEGTLILRGTTVVMGRIEHAVVQDERPSDGMIGYKGHAAGRILVG